MDFLGLGNSWRVGMPEYLAAEECSPLLHTSGFPGVMGTCHTKLQLTPTLHTLTLYAPPQGKGFYPQHCSEGTKNSSTGMGTGQHIGFMFKRCSLEKD